MSLRALPTVACALVAAAALLQAEGKVTVHVVPHTHDDVGWLKTVDEYYTGQNESIQRAYVHMVLDTVVQGLAENPDRTFTYVEQAFFQRWWRQQDEKTRSLTKELVARRQLQFTNGGWCMHDEAAPHYLDMIDQTTLGHKFLMDEFGVAPKTGWQLDPFGHSATQAALLSAEVGFTGLFFGRIDYQDLDGRRDPTRKEAEFVWRASPSLGAGAQVFSGLTGEYHGNYGPPSGFNFEDSSNDEPIQDDPELTNYNVPSRVQDFVDQAMDLANRTRGENIMFTMGSDFEWSNAHRWYTNLDKIIKYVNQDGRIQALYSTPEIYIEHKTREASSVSWPLKTDDFMPYADGPHQFWTGYFTSRPALKRYIRDTSAFLQVVRQMASLGLGKEAAADPGIGKLAEAMGVLQHHDAVSGTAKQHVTFDYAMRLARGRALVMPAVSGALSSLAGAGKGASFDFCILRNESVCSATQKATEDVQFVLWNGLAQSRSELVELPINAEHVQVIDSEGKEVPSQVVPSLHPVTNYGVNKDGSQLTLVFQAQVPPMGLQTYRFVAKGGKAKKAAVKKVSAKDSVTIENDFLALEFCDNTLCKITNKETGISSKAKQSWLWYQSSTGNDESGQKSGAYIFRPNKTEAMPVFAGTPTLKVVNGDLANEVHQTFGSWVSQRIRLAKGARHAEITYTVGPIPVGDGLGKEVVSRFTTDIASNDECFVDSNGREMLPHKKDYRQSWSFNQTEPVAGNFYPITTGLFIRDQKSQLTLLTDGSQAGTGCINAGQLEMMVHRDLLADDSRGVGEPLNETEYVNPYVGDQPGQHYGPGLIIRGKHLLSLEAPASAAKVWRPLQDQLYLPLMPFFADGELAGSSFTALAKALPLNVQVISLQPWDDKTVLLRLAHQFGLDEDADLSKPATVDLSELFAGRKIVSADERGLTATISREEVLSRRVAWTIDGEGKPAESEAPPTPGSFHVTLGPLQIRTFLVKFAGELTEVFV